MIQKSAQYLRRELPIRLAHRINEIRTLPFIVGCNPTILAVHELYIKAFHTLNDFPKIETPEDEERFAEVLKAFLDDHKEAHKGDIGSDKDALKCCYIEAIGFRMRNSSLATSTPTCPPGWPLGCCACIRSFSERTR